MKKIIIFIAMICGMQLHAQVSINTDGTSPSSSAMLEVKSASKGMLIPRVALINTLDNSTIPSPETSLMIYNTATAGVSPNNVTPGYYYWNGAAWTRFFTGSASLNDWTLTGNTGTIDGANFVGTADNIPFNIRVNNQKAGRITSNGPVFLGYQAGNVNTAVNNTGVGYQSLFTNNTGNSNTAFGRVALYSNISGNYNTAVGGSSLELNTASYNTALGFQAGNAGTTGSYNTILGYDADLGAGSYSNATVIGNSAVATASNQVRLGNAYVTSLFCQAAYVATSSFAPNLYVDASGQIMRSTFVASNSYWTLSGNAGAVDGVNFIGTTDDAPFNIRVNNQKAGRVASFGPVFLGYQAGNSNTATSSTGVGYQALYSNVAGANNAAYGRSALYSNIAGICNSAFGNNSLYLNTAGYNTAFGYAAGNIITTGTYNTLCGYDADLNAGNLTNATALGNGAMATASNQIRLGNGSITSLFCQGAYEATSNNAANVYVDNNGQIMRSTGTAGTYNWLLSGNGGTLDGVHFIGTTDDVPLNFRVNNQKAGRIASNGPVFLGYQSGNFNSGTGNTGVGYRSLYSNTNGYENTVVGFQAGNSNVTGSGNTCIGYDADLGADNLINSTALGNGSTATTHNQVRLGNASVTSFYCQGAYAATSSNAPNVYVDNNGQIMRSNGAVGGADWLLTGNAGTVDGTNFIGTTDDVPFNIRVNNQKAGRISSSGPVFLGYQAGPGNVATGNTGIGHQALRYNSTGDYNTAVGNNSLALTTAGYNTAVGYQAGNTNISGTYNTCIGYDADLFTDYYTNATVVGSGAIATGSNQVRLGNANVTSLYCQGAYAATAASAPNMYVDMNGQIMRSTYAVGGNGWLLAGNAGTLDGVNYIGTSDDVPFNIRVNNQKAGRVASTGAVFLGYLAGSSTTAASNTAIGYQALTSNQTGNFNTAIGHNSLFSTTAGYNTALGSSAGNSIITGAYNTCIGYDADLSAANFSNSTAIGNGAQATASNQVRLGNSSVSTLFCQGAYQATSSNASNVYVDNNGQIMRSTGTVGSLDWTPTGNAGTLDGINFIGTTDDVPVNIRVNNEKAGRVASTGVVFLGYQSGNNNTALSNTGVGFKALFSNTNANRNIAIGTSALFTQSFNNGGATWNSDNVAIGYEALFSNQPTANLNGLGNTALGNFALRGNTYGFKNTASGMNALFSNTSGSANTATGVNALYSNTTGLSNTATGFEALRSNVTGTNNTAVGYYALYSSATGYNTAIGYMAGENIVSGGYNTFIGSGADAGAGNFTNSTVIGNGAIGTTSNQVRLGNANVTSLFCQGAYEATSANAPNVYVDDNGQIMRSTGTTGGFNWLLTGNAGTNGTKFIGTTDNFPFYIRVNNQKSGTVASTGPVFLGYQAGIVSSSLTATGIGYQALHSNSTGENNTAAGYQALYSNTTGAYNNAVGVASLSFNTTGHDNSAIGGFALYTNTIGNYNIALGTMALNANTSSCRNIAIGSSALFTQSYDNDGVAWNSNNVAVGCDALYLTQSNGVANGVFNTAVGNGALRSNTSGNHNTACGGNALFFSSNGDYNTALGFNAGGSDVAGCSNSTALGYNALITASNQVRVGNTTVTSIGGYDTWTNISDARFKTGVKETVPGLDFILKLRPVTYHLDMEALASFLHTPDSLRNREGETAKAGIVKTGFIAQEVEHAAIQAGYDFSGVDKPKNTNDFYGLRYAEFVVPVVKAIQEQQAMIEEQKKINDLQQSMITELQKQNAELQRQMDELKRR